MIFDYDTLKLIWWLFVGVLLIGIMEAVLEERFNLTLLQATTSAGAPFVLVNGPHARAIGLEGSS